MFGHLDLEDKLAGLVRLGPPTGEDRAPWRLLVVGVLILLAVFVFLGD